MTLYNYAIAVGYNQPQGSLVNIELIRPPNDVYFYPPQGYSAYNPGTARIRLDDLQYETGYASTTWLFDTMTRLQYPYLRSTFCIGGGYSGTVTLFTPNQSGTFTRYNGIIRVPHPNELQRNFTKFRSVPITFIKLQTPT